MSQSQKWWSMGLLPLREELKSKGLETHGSKPVLVRRLEVYEERINALKAKSTPVQMRKSPAKSEVSSGEPAPVKESPPVPDTAKPDQQKSAVTDTESNQQQEEEKPKDWWTLSMQDLKNECSKRNLSFMGNKYTLVNRLKGYDSLNKKLLVSTIVKTNTPTPVASSPDAKVMPPTKQVTPPTQKPPDTTAPPAIKPTTPSPAKASPPVEQPQQDIVKVEIERINKLTLAQLKIECVNKKLNISGSRTELLERLKQHVQKAQNTTGSKLLSTPSVTSKPQTPAPSPVVTSIKVSESNWSPVAQKTPVTPSPTVKPPAAQAPVQVAPVKRIVTSSVGVQTDKTEEIDRPQPVKHFYSDEQVETAKKFSSKLPYWEDKNGKCPDVFLEYLPVKECERRARSLLLYPITYKDTQDPDFNKLRQTARSCILKFTDHRSINRALRGSVELEFFTRKACQTAQEQLKTWRKDLKVEMLSDHDTLDAALVKVGERPAKSEPTVNRLIFLNKLPMKLKEGSLAEKFSDAASICIAKDSFNVSKGYGFVESATTADAQAAFNKNRNLYLEGARIEVSMYPKVPANLEEDKHRLVLPDSERLKLSEKHHQATLDFNRAKSGPYNRDRSTDQSLLKEMSVLEEKLAVDAAIRKKLGYASLPEPASFMSTEMRKAWQTGDFSSFKVDLGGIHKDWGEPKVKAGAVTTKVEGKKDISGPTPAKVSKMDDSAKTDQVGRDEKMASSLSATLSQLKESEVEDKKRKEPPNQNRWNRPDSSGFKQNQEAGGSWQQKQENRDQRSTWNQQKQDSRGQQNTWNQQKQDNKGQQSTWNQQKQDSKDQQSTWNQQRQNNKGYQSNWNQQKQDNMGLRDSLNQQKDMKSQSSGGINKGWNQRGKDNQGGMNTSRNMQSGFGESKVSSFGANKMMTNESKSSQFGDQWNRFDKNKKEDQDFPVQFGRQSQSTSLGDNQLRNNKSSFGESQSLRFGEGQSSRFGESQSTQYGSNSGVQRFQGNQEDQFGNNNNKGSNFGKNQGLTLGVGPEKTGWGRGKPPSLLDANTSFPRERFGRGRGQMTDDFEDDENVPSQPLGRGRGSIGRNMSSTSLGEGYKKPEQPAMGRGKQNLGLDMNKSHFGRESDQQDVYDKFYGGEDLPDVNRDDFPMSFGSTKKTDFDESTDGEFGGGGMLSGSHFGMQGRQRDLHHDMDMDDEEDDAGERMAFGQKSFGRGSFAFGQQRGAPGHRGYGVRGGLQQEDKDEYDDDDGKHMAFGRGSNPATRFGQGSNRGNFRQTSTEQRFSEFGKQGNMSRFDNDEDDEMEFGGPQRGVGRGSNFGNFQRNQGFGDKSEGPNKRSFGQTQGNFSQGKPKSSFAETETGEEGGTAFGQGSNRGLFDGERSHLQGQGNFGQGRQGTLGQGQRQNRFDQRGLNNQFGNEKEENNAQNFGVQNKGNNKVQEDSMFGDNITDGFRRTPGAGARVNTNMQKQLANPIDTPKSQFGSGMNMKQVSSRFGTPQDDQSSQELSGSGLFNRQPRGDIAQSKEGPPSLLGRPPASSQKPASASSQNKDMSGINTVTDSTLRNTSGQILSNQVSTDQEPPPLPQQPQLPPQPPPPQYPEYDQKAYEEYYKHYGYDYSQAGYDYSQYSYPGYGQAGQTDWSQGYWGYPYGQPPPPASKQSESGQTQQSTATDSKMGQWSGYGYGQPPTSQSAAATGQQPWGSTSQPVSAAQGAEETVNTELVKKLGPAVSTLRQQMQYDNKEKKAESSNMPTFVSNMASYSSSKTQGYGGY